MNEIEKLGAQDAFAARLKRVGDVDPLFGAAERRWHAAKSHVARGHERERERMQNKGMTIGLPAGALVTGLMALGMRPGAAATAAALGGVAGAVAGRRAGAWNADRLLAISQTRGELGQYVPWEKRASSVFGGLARLAPATATVVGDTARAARSSVRTVKRTTIVPPKHKPKVVATPSPAPPRVEPTSFTPAMPSMSPTAKLGALDTMKKCKRPARKNAGPRAHIQGQDMDTGYPGPSNEPVRHAGGAGGPRDF